MALAARPICGTSERWEIVSATQITRSVAPNDGGPEDGSPIITAARRTFSSNFSITQCDAVYDVA